MKRVAIIVSSILAFFVLLLWGVRYIARPMGETKLLQSFYAHRSSFEQLRDMLNAEHGVTYISPRGQNTLNVNGERLENYLSLMRGIPAVSISRLEKTPKHPERLVIVLWAVGFGGDGAQSGICWTDENPVRQVSSLDAFYRNPASCPGTGWVFRHIESNWYLWTDRQTGLSRDE